MTLSPALRIPPPDARQSPTALSVQRGVRRLFARMDMASVPELTLASGRRADLVLLGRDGGLAIVEIKSCLADFRADRKWTGYRDFCDRFYFAVTQDFPSDVLPAETGLIVADAFGAEIVREAPLHPLAGARRKAVTLRFAHAAGALHMLADPESRALAPL